MNTAYNKYNLEASFKKYLLAENISDRTIKNYLSDLRFFLGWIHNHLRNTGKLGGVNPNFSNLDLKVKIIANLNSQLIQNYKSYMQELKLPSQTINRRLSSVRKFCQMAVKNKWLESNPALTLKSVPSDIVESKKHNNYPTCSTSPLQESKSSIAQTYQFTNTTANPVPDQTDIDTVAKNKGMPLNTVSSGFETNQYRQTDAEKLVDKYSLNEFNQKPHLHEHSVRHKYNSNPLVYLSYIRLPTYITTVLILLVLVASIGLLATKNQRNQTIITSAKTGVLTAGRSLTFRGVLRDTLGNLIDSKTDVSFRLYSSESAVVPIYTAKCQGVNGVAPDSSGVFTVVIGKDCNTQPIPAHTFSDNTNLYLGVSAGGDSEMKPRQHIPNVGYAIASESIGGLTVGINASSIPFINAEGSLLIAAKSPKIESTNGVFTLQGEAIVLSTPTDTGGDISFSPGLNGDTLITTGSLGVGTLLPSAKLDVSGDASISGNLTFRGVISQINQLNGGDLAFATSTGGTDRLVDRLVVTNDGSIGIGTSYPVDKLTVRGNIVPASGSLYSLGSASHRWETVFANQLIASESGIIGYWQRTAGLLAPISKSDDLILGSTEPKDAIIKLSASGSKQSWINGERLGIGTVSPDAKLHLTGALTGRALAIFDEIGDQNILSASASGTTKFVITHNGHVGINSIDPATDLDVNGTVRLSATGTATTNGLCHSGANSDTSFANRDVVACSSAPGDIAEWYETQDAQAGDIIVATGKTVTFASPVVNAKTGELTSQTDTISAAVLTKSTTEYQNDVLGVISTSPYQTFGRALFDASSNPNPVALAGRVPVKISAINGPIKPGDPIAASPLPGVGMLAKEPGVIIGRALESYNSIDRDVVGKITILVNVTWNDPTIRIAQSGDVQSTYEPSKSPGGLLTQTNQRPQGDNIVVGVMNNMTASIIQSSLVANAITTNTTSSLAAGFNSLSTSFLQAVDAQLNRLIVSEKIISPVVETDNLIVKDTARINKLVTSSIAAEKSDLEINLDPQIASNSGEVDRGELAALVIKGLAGKAVARIDGEGAASFSGTLAARSLEAQDASISGRVVAHEIQVDKIDSLELDTLSTDVAAHNDRIDQLNTHINSVQQSLADLQPKTTSSIGDNLLQQAVDMQAQLTGNIAADSLNITGTANLFNLYVADKLTTGNIVLQNDAILALADTLDLSAFSKITFFHGSIAMTKDGTITTEGEVVAKGGIKTNTLQPLAQEQSLNVQLKGRSDTSKLSITDGHSEVAAINNRGDAHFSRISLDTYLQATAAGAIIAAAQNFKNNGLYAPAIETARETAGIGLLPVDSDEIVIYNDSLTEQSLVYLTPVDNIPGTQLTVAAKQACTNKTGDACRKFFKVLVGSENHPDLRFNWLIIN